MGWDWPQYAYAALTMLGLGVSLQRHGQRKTGEHNIVADVIATAIIVWLLYMGGFWASSP